MKIVIILALTLSFISCSRTRSITDATSTKSSIDPLFVAKNLNQKFNGDSIKLKVVVPLSQNTLGHYNIHDVLAPTCDEEASNYKKCLEKLEEYNNQKSRPDEDKSFWQKMTEDMKFDIYNTFIKFGVSSRLRYTFDWDFDYIDTTYLKEVKVKKIFFALDECEMGETDCTQRAADDPLTFDFLEKFFINLSVIQEHDSLEFLKKPLSILKKDHFNRYSEKAFGKIQKNIRETIDEEGETSDHLFYDVNIAKFDNSKKQKKRTKGDEKNQRDNGRTFIFKLEENRVHEAKSFFQSVVFEGIVSDITLTGKNLYVELYHPQLKKKFFDTINENVADVYSLGVKDFKGCTSDSCTYLNVNDINLVPMMEKSKRIKFDTFLSIRKLDYNDFKYSGYIELAIELDLPL